MREVIIPSFGVFFLNGRLEGTGGSCGGRGGEDVDGGNKMFGMMSPRGRSTRGSGLEAVKVTPQSLQVVLEGRDVDEEGRR